MTKKEKAELQIIAGCVHGLTESVKNEKVKEQLKLINKKLEKLLR